MSKLIPFFELNGKRYEIYRTRYLVAEYDKLSENVELSKEDRANAIKAQSLIGDIQRYAEKMNELEEKYFETFDDEDERKYLKAKELYNKALDELTLLETETGSTVRVQKASIDILEKIAIKGLAEQYFNMDEEKAKSIWESYVDTLPSTSMATEWLNRMAECLFGNDEIEDNSFLAQTRKAAKEKAANRKVGIAKKK